MPSSHARQHFTTPDLVMLDRVLDHAGLTCDADEPGREKRTEAARVLIALFQQGVTRESDLVVALNTSLDAPKPVTSRGYQSARDAYHSRPTATVMTAGGYRYGRRVEKNGTWTIYHVFSGVPAEFASWKMVGLNVKTAERALKILNTPRHAG